MRSLPHRGQTASRRPTGAVLAALALALAAVGVTAVAAAWRGDSSGDSEAAIDRAYAAYQVAADALVDSPDCATGIARAAAVVRDRRADLDAAFALQSDPARMEEARAQLEARESRYLEISARLDAGFTRCEGKPGLAALGDALDRAR